MRSITVLTSETHCSVSAPRRGSDGKTVGPGKAAIEIGGDGLRFEKLDIAVAHDGHLAERMNGEDLRRAKLRLLELVFDPFSSQTIRTTRV